MRMRQKTEIHYALTLAMCVLAGTWLSGNVQAQTVSTRPASAQIATSQPAAVSQSTSAPTSQSTNKRRPYTAPGASVRGMSLGQAAVALSLGAAATPASNGKEISESAFSTSSLRGDLAGRPGLEGSPKVSGNGINTRGGIVPGRGGALGFAGANTLLTARPNPLSGANGIGQQLIKAGFAPGAFAGVRSFGK